MVDCSDIRLVHWGGILWANYDPQYIAIDNVLGWLEYFIIKSLIHETIHLVINELEGHGTTQAFDNLFGFIDPTVILCPQEDEYYYDRIQRKRIERLWKALARPR